MMNERKAMNLFMYLLIILVIGAMNMRPVNTTTFVVWPPEVLEKHGHVRPLSFGELILAAENLRLSPTQVNVLEASPRMQGSVPGISEIISVVRGEREPGADEKWGVEPDETSVRATDSGELGMPVETIPSKEPAPTQPEPTPTRVPRRRPIPQ